VQKKSATFANHTSYVVWETMVQHREWAWKAVGNRLQGPCYLSMDDCDQKIKAKKQRTHTRKYSFVNRTIKLCNQLPAEALATFSCRSHIFKKRVRKVLIREVKCIEGSLSVLIKCLKVEESEKLGVK